MITTNPQEPALHVTKPDGQNEAYLVLPEEDRRKGFVRAYRDTYTHDTCGRPTTMNRAIAETYARNPKYYGSTFCCHCRQHFPVEEFRWTGEDMIVGT